MSAPTVVQLIPRESWTDPRAAALASKAREHLSLHTGKIRIIPIFVLLPQLPLELVRSFASEALRDRLLHRVLVGEPYTDPAFRSFILLARHPGVTDDVGTTAQKTLRDYLDRELGGRAQLVFSQTVFLLENPLPKRDLRRIAHQLLGNPLIHHFEYGPFRTLVHFDPSVGLPPPASTRSVDIDIPDSSLLELSRRMVLSLDLAELHAIQAHFRDPAVRRKRRRLGLPPSPTDCELEVLGQTWSEHCKHKEFNAVISYRDLDTGQELTVDSLFRTYIRGATEKIRDKLRQHGNDWLVKIFSDNAGVVRIDRDRLFVWKVETHNTPSALDPYGGAITGILGNNRDPLGTGVGGGRLLFNTNVLCFASPYYDGPLQPGQLHPERVFQGVRHGIEDGGNKSGVPTVNGAIVFDDRYAGKPLVYCGTGSIMPATYDGLPSWEKNISPGDRILMAGGRVGKDGIHGATFSSTDLDEHSPRTAVQIGSPITQKLLSDFLEEACNQGLVKCSTDNGAGGLSSSVGELAPISGGARVHLERVPLKYPGLAPWEIFVSEAQERMTLVVEPTRLDQLMSLARHMEVEVTDIGSFTDNGELRVYHGSSIVASLDLHFLHEGLPRKHMEAHWQAPRLREPVIPQPLDHGKTLLRLLSSLDICSREPVIRQYDHEVKGKTVIKPLMGPRGHAPQDAAVMLLSLPGQPSCTPGSGPYDGIAISNGIIPRYGDLDPYHMSAGAFDEAIRQIISVGGSLPDPARAGNRFWTVNDNFCLPDSAHHPRHNPDGRLKLGRLVRMAMALYDMSVFFGIPMTSGKDSMKNDFRVGEVKVSIPPTVLYSAVARIPDVRLTVTSQFKAPGDIICLLGDTWPELGGSELFRLWGETGATVPRVRMEAARDLYLAMGHIHQRQLLESSHDLSDGGLAVALAECCMGADLGASLDLSRADLANLELHQLLYSESHSRFLVSLRPPNLPALQAILPGRCHVLGQVSARPSLHIRWQGRTVLDLSVGTMLHNWSTGLEAPPPHEEPA